MVEINLLPWRDARRRHQTKKIKVIFALSVMSSLCILVFFYSYLVKQTALVQAQVVKLKQQLAYDERQKIRRVNKTVVSVVDPAKVVLGRHVSTMQLLADMGGKQDVDICFTKMERISHHISFSGYARSMADVSDFLRHWKAGALFAEIKIEQLQQQQNDLVLFRFHAQEKGMGG